MRHFIVRSREELHYMIIMDVLQITMIVFMVGALGAVVVGVIAMAVNGKPVSYTHLTLPTTPYV